MNLSSCSLIDSLVWQCGDSVITLIPLFCPSFYLELEGWGFLISGRGAQSVSLVSAVGWMLFITGLEVHRLNEPGVCQYRLLPLCQVHAKDMLLSASSIDLVCSHSIGHERKTALGR